MGEFERPNKVENKRVEQESEEKWVKYYSSLHQILLVGEGDFSFSTCLAQSFGSAANIVASSLDSYDEVIEKYKKAESNFSILDKLGASHLHGIDATKMKFHSDLRMRKFDRIIFNFPHAGFTHKGVYCKEDDNRLIMKHKTLLGGFFKNACGMLQPDGEIHVNHKTSFPYCNWNLEKLASQNSLRLVERVAFNKEDYLGYENKRGSGKRCDDCFLLGQCCTFKFSFSKAKETKVKRSLNRSRNLAKAPKFVPQKASPFEFRHPSSDSVPFMSDSLPLNIPCGRSREICQTPTPAFQHGNYLEYKRPRELLQGYAYQQGNVLEHKRRNYLTFEHPPSEFDLGMSGIPKHIGSPNIYQIYLECSRIFSPYFERVAKAFKNPDHNSCCFLEEALKVGYERYMAGDPRRTLSDYRYILEQLRKHFVGKPEGQVSRQLTIENDFASASRTGHYR